MFRFYYKCYKIIAYKFWCTFNIINDSCLDYTIKNANNDIIKSMVSTCLVWISLALSEGIYILIATALLNIGVDKLMDNTSLTGAIITLPSLLIMFLIVILLKYIKCNILKFKIRS